MQPPKLYYCPSMVQDQKNAVTTSIMTEDDFAKKQLIRVASLRKKDKLWCCNFIQLESLFGNCVV